MRSTRTLALLSGAGAVIHASVVAEHFQEDPLFGWFFLAVVGLQVGWAALLLRRPSSRVLAAGALGNAVLVGMWVLTRTLGVPVGPEVWKPESIGLADALASTLEVVTVVIVSTVLRRGWVVPARSETPIVRWLPPAAVTVLSSAIIVTGFAGYAASSTPRPGHGLHFAILGAAGLVFSGYLGIEFFRHGTPAFSWRLRSHPTPRGST